METPENKFKFRLSKVRGFESRLTLIHNSNEESGRHGAGHSVNPLKLLSIERMSVGPTPTRNSQPIVIFRFNPKPPTIP